MSIYPPFYQGQFNFLEVMREGACRPVSPAPACQQTSPLVMLMERWQTDGVHHSSTHQTLPSAQCASSALLTWHKAADPPPAWWRRCRVQTWPRVVQLLPGMNTDTWRASLRVRVRGDSPCTAGVSPPSTRPASPPPCPGARAGTATSSGPRKTPATPERWTHPGHSGPPSPGLRGYIPAVSPHTPAICCQTCQTDS